MAALLEGRRMQVLRRARWPLVLAALAPVAAAVAALALGPDWFGLLWLVPILGLFFPAVWMLGPRPIPVEQDVAITTEGIWVGGSLAVQSHRIATYHVRRPGAVGDQPLAMVYDIRGRVLVALRGRDEAETRGTIDALQAIAPASRTAFVVSRWTWAAIGLMSVLPAIGAILQIAFHAHPFNQVALMLPGLWWLLLLRARPDRVIFRDDGILRLGLGRLTFIGYATIRDVADNGWKGTELKLHDGTTSSLTAYREPHAEELAMEIRAALARYRALPSTTPTEAPALLREVGRRSAKEWVKELRRAKGSEDPVYRRPGQTEDALWNVLESPTADALSRAAAAVALAQHPDEATRVRVAAVTSTIGRPELRLAVEAAVDEYDDEELGQKLEALKKR